MTDGKLEEQLRACTVRVEGSRPGAGFLVAPGVILTCAHVVGTATSLNVRWDTGGGGTRSVPATVQLVLRHGGRPIPGLDDDYPDVAVLVADLGGHPCVGLDEDWPSYDDGFQCYGYPSEGGSVILTPARFTYGAARGSSRRCSSTWPPTPSGRA